MAGPARESIDVHPDAGAQFGHPLVPAKPRPLILSRSKDERARTSGPPRLVIGRTRPIRHLPLLLAAVMLAATLLGGSVASADSSVSIVDAPRPQPKWGYGPATVRVAPGSWVTWSNVGGDTHTVTAGDGSFDSGPLDPGEGFSWYFDQPGRFAYVCALHPWMKGTVVVGDPGPASTSDQITVSAPVGGMVPASSSASGPGDQAVSSDPSDSTDPTAVVADPAN